MVAGMELSQALALIRDIPDFPHKGILFKDITPLLADPEALQRVINELSLSERAFTHVAGIEARGFIFGTAIALHTLTGFIPIRKAGKLPFTTFSRSYGLEYGSDKVEIHTDALSLDDSVLLVDDVLATGGTIIAALELIAELGAQISEVVVLVEIEPLGGRARILERFPSLSIRSIVKVK